MACCDDPIYPVNGKYEPLNQRLLNYGKDTYGKQLMDKYKHTHMWIFTFYDNDTLCEECTVKFARMNQWFNKYGLLEDTIKNVKWTLDDEIENNLILRDLHIEKFPVHLFADKDGKIFDVLYGFPENSWLEKYILPSIRKEVI